MAVGIMGYGLMGIVAWAQKFYLLSQLNVLYMPSAFQQLGETYKWSMLDFRWVPVSAQISVSIPGKLGGHYPRQPHRREMKAGFNEQDCRVIEDCL